MATSTSLNQSFLKKVEEIVINNLSNESFSTIDIQTELSLSGSQIYRKIKEGSGCSPSIFVRNIKLQYTSKLIQHTDLSLSEIAFSVGFNSLSYFSKSFSDYYGFPPSSLRNE